MIRITGTYEERFIRKILPVGLFLGIITHFYPVFNGKIEFWAINTRVWINTTNSKVKKSWTTSTSKSTVKSEERAVSDYSYVYYLN